MIRRRLTTSFSLQPGFAYLEALIATLLVMLALVPALEALTPALQGSAIHLTEAELQYHAAGKLQEMLAQPFAELDAEAQALADPATLSSVYSDSGSATNRRLVFLSRYDADNADADGDPFTGMDAGLIWIRVTIPNTRLDLESLTSVYD